MLNKCRAVKTSLSLLLSHWQGASTSRAPGWVETGTQCQSGSLSGGLPGGGSPSPHCPLTLPSLRPDITGPIILQTYRAIADFEKTSSSQMALATGDVVDVVEKSESGQCPCPAQCLSLCGPPYNNHRLGVGV